MARRRRKKNRGAVVSRGQTGGGARPGTLAGAKTTENRNPAGGLAPAGLGSTKFQTTLSGGVAQNALGGGALGGPVGAGVGAGLGILGDLIGAATPGTFTGVTEEQIQQAIDAINRGFGKAEDISQGPKTGGGVTQSGSGFASGKEVKQEQLPVAAQAFLESQGLSPEEAANAVKEAQGKRGGLAKNLRNMGFGGLKGFIRQEGDQYGLNVNKGGKIRGERRVESGGIESDTDELKDTATGINQGTLGGLGGAPEQLGQDIQEGFGFSSEIRDLLRKELLNSGPEGLTEQDISDLAKQDAADFDTAQRRFRDNLQRTTGQLVNQGFASSNLAAKALERGAYDPLARNLQQLEANQASRRQNILNQRAARKNQRVASLLGAAGGLGSRDLSAVNRSLVNPASFGGFTDPQAEAALRQQGQFDANLQAQRGQAQASAHLTPTTQQEQGGFFGF